MANVLFKRGQQATLNAQGFQAQDGVFYLTQDTNRLYVGEGTSLKLLNQTVQIVASLNELLSTSNNWDAAAKAAHRNDFYYIPANQGDHTNTHGGNILVVWDGTEWVQINPDTDTKLESVTVSASAQNNIASVTVAAEDGTSNQNLTDTFTITGSGGVQVTGSGKNVNLVGETYTLSHSIDNNTNTAIIQLDATLGTDSSVNLVAGNNISFSTPVGGSGGIKIDAVDSQVNSATLSIPAAGSLAIDVTDTNGGEGQSTLQNVGIAVGAGTGNVGNYYVPITSTANKTAANIYTAEEIDSLINGLDGMTFKGTFGTGGTVSVLPTTGVRNGDTYVIISNGMTASDIPGLSGGSLGSDGTRVGDMVIANGTETDGFISSGLSWVYVPSGNDAADAYSYTAVATAATNTLLLRNQIPTDIARISLTAGTDVNITSTATDGSLSSTISHATYNAVTPVADSNLSTNTATFTAIKGLTLSNGHITGITTDTFTPLTYTLSGATVTEGTRFGASSSTNDITAQIALADNQNGARGTADVKLSSSSITLTRSNDSIVMDLVWGSF